MARPLAETDPELIESFNTFAFDEVPAKEVVYQAVPCCGMDKTYDFMGVTNEVPQLLPFIGYPRTLNALAAIDEIANN